MQILRRTMSNEKILLWLLRSENPQILWHKTWKLVWIKTLNPVFYIYLLPIILYMSHFFLSQLFLIPSLQNLVISYKLSPSFCFLPPFIAFNFLSTHLNVYLNMTYSTDFICFLFKSNKWRSFLSEQIHICKEIIKISYLHYSSVIGTKWVVKK